MFDRIIMFGIAMHNYHDLFMALPPAGFLDAGLSTGPTGLNSAAILDWSEQARLLPYFKQQNLSNLFNFDLTWDSPANLGCLEHRQPRGVQSNRIRARAGNSRAGAAGACAAALLAVRNSRHSANVRDLPQSTSSDTARFSRG